MKRFFKTGTMILIVSIFVLSANKSFAQIPTVQDCLGAIPICQPVFSESDAYQGTGNYLDEIGPSSCLSSGEKNDVWYIFTVSQAGNLNFSITPNDLSDDYDWAVYNVTDNVCGDIFDTPGMQVSCNYSGTNGVTGPNGGSSLDSQGGGGTPFNATVPVQFGDIYVINVSQFSPSLNGYTIDFTNSTADIYDDVTPRVLRVASTEFCDSSVVSIHFNENILCSSVDALDFRVFGNGNPVVTHVTSPTCDITGNSGYGIDFKLHLDRPLELGNYGIVVYPHTDHSVIDNCGNQCNGGLPEQVTFSTVPEGGMSITLEPTHISCFGETDGVINATALNHSPLAEGGDLMFSFEGDPTDFTGVYTGLSAGTYTVDIQTVGGCIGDATIEIVEPPQAFSDAGSSKVICGLPEYTMQGNIPEVGVGTWTTDATQYNFADANNGTTFLTNIPYGEHTYTWTVDNGVCGSFTDDIIITRYPSNNYAGPDQETCEPANFQLSGQNAFPGTGEWTANNGASISNSSIYNTTAATLPFGETTFTWTMDINECGILSDDFVVFNYEMPTFAYAGDDDDFCEKSGQLVGDIPTIGTGTWTSTSGTLIVTPSANNTLIQNLDPGTNDFTWTIANGVCPEVTDVVTIERLSASDALAGTDFSVCNSDTILFGNIPQNGTGVWIPQGTATLANTTVYNTAVTNLEEGVNEFVWQIQNQACPASTDTVFITNYMEPSLADAGSNERVCGNSFVLNGNSPDSGIGFWTTSGSAIISDATSDNTVATNLSEGVNIFTWTISSGVCLPQEDIILIMSDEDVGTAITGSDKITCEDESVLVGNSPTVGTGSWTEITGDATITDPNNSYTTVTSLGFGVNQFRWRLVNGSCSSQDIMEIYRNPAIPDANAGTDLAVCDPTHTLNGSSAGAATGFWTTTGSAIIDNSASNVTDASSLVLGENTFVWNITDGLCDPKSDTIIVTLDEEPSLTNAGTDDVICSAITSLNAGTPIVGTGSWISAGDAIIANDAVQNTVVVNLQVGDNSFIWRVTNGSCPPAKDEVIITRDFELAITDAGEDIYICEGGDVSLNANDPLSEVGTWTTTSGVTIETSNLYNTAVSNLNTGVNTLTWTTQYGVCPPNSDEVDVVVEEMPTTANAGEDVAICEENTILTANAPTVGTGVWSSTGDATITNVNAQSTSVENLALGANSFFWTITGIACPPSTSEVVIFQDSQAAVDAGVNEVVCGANASLNANSPVSGTGVWISDSGVTFTQNSAFNTNASNLNYGDNILTWQVSGGACPPASSEVTITRETEPSIADAGTDFHVCEETATLDATIPTVGSGYWFHNGLATTVNSTMTDATYSNLGEGESVFYWVVENGVCPPSQDSVIVAKDVKPIATTESNYVVCADSSFISALTPTVGVGYWTTSGNGQIDDVNTTNPFVRLMNSGVNTFYWNVDNGVCPTDIDSMTVTAFHDILAPVPNTEDLPELTAECSFTITELPVANDNCKGEIIAYTNDEVTITQQGTHVITWNFDDGNGNISTQEQTVIINDVTEPEIECIEYLEVSTNVLVDDVAYYSVNGTEFDPVLFTDNCFISELENSFSQDTTLMNVELPEGTTEITWTVVDGNLNKKECKFAVRVFSEVKVFEAFSPNGDGKNDLFYISGLAALPLNSLTIYNRWGVKVYEQAPYDNSWDGKSNEGVSIGGSDLPAGTYYYILETGEGDDYIKGFIHLER